MVLHAISPAPRRELLSTAALAPLELQFKGCCDNNCKECHGTEQVNRCATQNPLAYSCSSAESDRLKPGVEGEIVIAAVNRCATKIKVAHGLSAASEVVPIPKAIYDYLSENSVVKGVAHHESKQKGKVNDGGLQHVTGSHF